MTRFSQFCGMLDVTRKHIGMKVLGVAVIIIVTLLMIAIIAWNDVGGSSWTTMYPENQYNERNLTRWRGKNGERQACETVKNSRKLILLWDWRHGRSGPGNNCDHKCVFTKDRNKINSSHVVIFEGRFLHKSTGKLPQSRRSENQLWVFYTREAPTRFMEQSRTTFDKYAFNITSTYSASSDVPIPKPRYFRINDLDDHSEITIDYTKGKHKMAAWFVSHCKTQSRREEFIRELSKHIPVDIYGKCGPLDCPRSEQQRCWTMLNTTYKFYLAFENSLCQEYVTEKVWNIYERNINIIPVVMGGANYSSVLPKGSFIDVSEFVNSDISSAALKLAIFLRRVANDKFLYNEYIDKMRKYFYEKRIQRMDDYSCKLCDYITQQKTEKPLESGDITKFWTGREAIERQCVHPDSYYRVGFHRR